MSDDVETFVFELVHIDACSAEILSDRIMNVWDSPQYGLHQMMQAAGCGMIKKWLAWHPTRRYSAYFGSTDMVQWRITVDLDAYDVDSYLNAVTWYPEFTDYDGNAMRPDQRQKVSSQLIVRIQRQIIAHNDQDFSNKKGQDNEQEA